MQNILNSNLSSKLEKRLNAVISNYITESDYGLNLTDKVEKTNKHMVGSMLVGGASVLGGIMGLAISLHMGGQELAQSVGSPVLLGGTSIAAAAIAYAGIAKIVKIIRKSEEDKYNYNQDYKYTIEPKALDLKSKSDEVLNKKIKKIEESFGVDFSESDIEKIKNLSNPIHKNETVKNSVKDLISNAKMKK